MTTKGVACKMADVLDNDVVASAKVKNKRAAISQVERKINARSFIAGWNTRSLRTVAQSMKNNMPNMPKMISICAIGSVWVMALTSMSSTENAAIATTMKNAPRTFASYEESVEVNRYSTEATEIGTDLGT